MARYTGTTAQRGYGWPHQKLRLQRLKQYQPGDPCAHCGRPMNYPPGVARRYLDLPHTDDRSGYLPGLAHRSCNRRDGQRKTSAILRARGYQLTPRQLTAIRAKAAAAQRQSRQGGVPAPRQPSRW